MTLDQYLVTVAWLWIAYILYVVFVCAKRQPDTEYYSRIVMFYWILPAIPYLMYFQRQDKFAIVLALFMWSAYPLYLWVSTSFAFNITYIGG